MGKIKNTTLMRKLTKYFVAVILIMLILNIYSISGFKAFYENFYSLLKKPVQIQAIKGKLEDAYKNIESYGHSGSDEYSSKYSIILNDINLQLKSFQTQSKGEEYYNFKDTLNMLDTFDINSKAIIRNYNNGIGQIYVNRQLSDLFRLKGYIQDQIDEILQSQLYSVQDYYKSFKADIGKEELLIYLLSFIVSLLCILLAYKFSQYITRPIHELALKLKRVAQGNLDVAPTKLTSNGEINVLIEASNYMIKELNCLIEEMKEKAELESKLKQQDIRNLEVSNLLKQSQLNLLQSQINPHFLYNTLNSISALAELEDAEQTKRMLDSMSSLVRYNLKKQNERVTLKEEIDLIQDYIYIQSIRFGNRIEYVLDIDENAVGYKVPSMILQPFVENAIIHGLEPKEGKGLLEIKIKENIDNIEIVIKDNGLGISQEKIDEILEYNEIPSTENNTKGIGVNNVIQRLKIINNDNTVRINSSIGIGTEVVIKLKVM